MAWLIEWMLLWLVTIFRLWAVIFFYSSLSPVYIFFPFQLLDDVFLKLITNDAHLSYLCAFLGLLVV